MADIGQRPARSSFVTGLAWTFIILGGFATLIAILQNIMVGLVMSDEAARATLDALMAGGMSAFGRFMIANIRLFVAATLALSVISFAAGIGLLKRKNWARIVTIALLALGVVSNLAGMIVPFLIFPSSMPVPADAPAGFSDPFETMMKIMTWVTVAIAFVFAVLFGWAIRRLYSAEIRREFGVE